MGASFPYQNLRIPGPTPLPPEVLKAISSQMINHRGSVYEEIQKRVTENLKYFFQTKNDLFLLTSSGMGGLEAAIVNFFSPGDTLVFFTVGEFGNRWAEIARKYGANVIHVKFPPGTAVTRDMVYQTIETTPEISGVFITHNETATGVLNRIDELKPLIKSHKSRPLFLIDSISALGAVELPMDELEIDILVSASQKAWMAPPGIAFIAVSQAAWERHKIAKMPSYYWDLSMYKKFSEKSQTPATPAVSTLFGLDASLQLMKKEGREKIYKRHLQLTKYLRAEIKKSGLELFVKDTDASPTVTSIKIPQDADGHELLKKLREEYGVILAGGMGETKGKIIRIAHMGFVSKVDLDNVLASLKEVIPQ